MTKSYDFAETLMGECKCIGIVLQSATFGRAPPSGQPVWTILYQNEGDPTLLRKHVHPPIGVDPFSRACLNQRPHSHVLDLVRRLKGPKT